MWLVRGWCCRCCWCTLLQETLFKAIKLKWHHWIGIFRCFCWMVRFASHAAAVLLLLARPTTQKGVKCRGLCQIQFKFIVAHTRVSLRMCTIIITSDINLEPNSHHHQQQQHPSLRSTDSCTIYTTCQGAGTYARREHMCRGFIEWNKNAREKEVGGVGGRQCRVRAN